MYKYIIIIEPDGERKFFNPNDYSGVIDLGLHSPLSAVLLNALLVYKKKCCNRKRHTYWNYNSCLDNLNIASYELVGGGMLVHGDPDIFMSKTGKVGIKFNDVSELNKVMNRKKNVPNFGEFRTRMVKEKLAKALKDFWDFSNWNSDTEKQDENATLNLTVSEYAMSAIFDPEIYRIKNNEIGKLLPGFTINTRISITKDQYRCLYEYFKGKDADKLKAKYGNDVYNAIIGKELEDQFLISAIDITKTEIEKIRKMYEDLIENAQITYQNNLQSLKINYPTVLSPIREGSWSPFSDGPHITPS